MSGPIRVLMADDHHVVRAGLRAVLESEPDIAVVAEAATGEGAVARAREGGVDVVLMDLQFAGGGVQGVDATSAITGLEQPPTVLVLTTYDSDADITAALSAGACGYLLKDTPPDDLADAIREAAAGRSPMGPSITSRLVERVRRPATVLSSRELEVVQLVADGLSNKEIGQRLFLSEATVKSHLVHVFQKLGTDSRTAAAAAARARGLIRL
jgi:DNA-binding NarL/FixJ family response regulator